jgi:hypothetical protein
MFSRIPCVLVGFLPVTLLALACAARQSSVEAPRAPESGSCSRLSAAEVSSALAERLTAASDVLSFEHAWRTEHQGDVAGTISRAEVVRVVRGQNADIKACYDAALSKLSDNKKGKVVVRFIIDASGRVPAATIAADELGVPDVACCLAERVAQWTFGPPSSGDFVVVEYPFSVSVSKG